MAQKEHLEKLNNMLDVAIDYTNSPSFRNSIKSMLLTKSEIEQFMPKNANDPRFVVISGHLLIERIFDDFVRSRLKRPEMIDGKEINYRQLIAFAKAMQSRDIIQTWMYKAMNILAILRDIYAHNLEPKDGRKNIEKFIVMVKTNTALVQTKIDGEFSELASAIIILAITISGLLQTEPFLTGTENSTIPNAL